MKTPSILIVMFAAAVVASASPPDAPGRPAQMVITVLPTPGSGAAPSALEAHGLTLLEGSARVPVVRLERLAGGLAGMQLLVVLDDSTRSDSLGIQLPALRSFVASAPASTQVGVGYIRNGGLVLAQPFTTDPKKAAGSLRLPEGVPGVNASPYFALSNLVRHWPSKEPAERRAVLFFTDGVDRYFTDPGVMDDPYVDASVEDALKNGVAVYSVYLRGSGLYGMGDWTTSVAQSRLIQVSEETGGYAYQEDFTDPVSIAPFLTDFQSRLGNQYRVTFQALGQRGEQPVKLRTETPGLKIEAPSRIYVQ